MENFSQSKCPKCENTRFEMVEESPTGSKYKVMFIRCSSCKTVVSTEPYFNTGKILENLANELNLDIRKIF